VANSACRKKNLMSIHDFARWRWRFLRLETVESPSSILNNVPRALRRPGRVVMLLNIGLWEVVKQLGTCWGKLGEVQVTEWKGQTWRVNTERSLQRYSPHSNPILRILTSSRPNLSLRIAHNAWGRSLKCWPVSLKSENVRRKWCIQKVMYSKWVQEKLESPMVRDAFCAAFCREITTLTIPLGWRWCEKDFKLSYRRIEWIELYKRHVWYWWMNIDSLSW